jgi:hypothetical protein
MAGGAIAPSDGPATDYGGSLTLSVFMTCLVAASGGLIFGYDIGISGALKTAAPFLFLALWNSCRAHFLASILCFLALNSELITG